MNIVLGIAAVLALGFGVGRIKNASKLAAAKAEIAKLEAKAQGEGLWILAKLKALL